MLDTMLNTLPTYLLKYLIALPADLAAFLTIFLVVAEEFLVICVADLISLSESSDDLLSQYFEAPLVNAFLIISLFGFFSLYFSGETCIDLFSDDRRIITERVLK